MRIIQTFWTAGKSLLRENFGWASPQYHLMSWSLSCECIKLWTDEIVLYTDTEGARILSDMLQLPYSEIKVCYDKLQCNPSHWALPKIYSYAMQERPFIHVDGDLFLPHGIPLDLLESDVVVQNKEMGTIYYKGMMNRILGRNPILPNHLINELKKDSIGSYNMGLFGGKNIDFIQSYCEESLKIVHDNGWDDIRCKVPDVNYNLLFEQVLLYSKAENEGMEVCSFIKKILGDNQYSYSTICDMDYFDCRTLLHMLGGHKRREYACEMLAKTLMRKYPERYLQVVKLFKGKHHRLCSEHVNRPSVQRAEVFVARYCDYVQSLCKKWDDVNSEIIYQYERASADFSLFISLKNDVKYSFNFVTHPMASLFHVPMSWDDGVRRIIGGRIENNVSNNYSEIAIVPVLCGRGYREVQIDDMQYNIMTILKGNPMNFESLMQELNSCVDKDVQEVPRYAEIVVQKMQILSFYNLILTYPIYKD